MLTYLDAVELSTLTEQEIEAIAEHEHIPEMCAAEMGAYLMQGPNGTPALKKILLDDIAHAESKGHEEHAKKLKMVLWHFLETHPENPKNK